MTQESKRILVIEDSELHQISAREQFKEYILEIAVDYESGVKAIEKVPDVMLTDLMMPKGNANTLSPEGMQYLFDEFPYGFPLALLAAKQGVKYIGVVTDINHHNHPMSACLDVISGAYWRKEEAKNSIYRINNSLLGIFHAPFIEENERKKDWKSVLEILIESGGKQ